MRHAQSDGGLIISPVSSLPTGDIASPTRPALTVRATRPHPADAVQVVVRRGGSWMPVPATRSSAPGASYQEFTAILPELRNGARYDYRVQLIRAGQVVAAIPAYDSWIGVTGVPNSEGPVATAPPSPAASEDHVRPRQAYELEYLASLSLAFHSQILGPTPEGYRANFFVEGGNVSGPRITATVLQGGGDWLLIRHDGIGVLDARTTWCTDGGALILDSSGGILELGEEGYAKIAAGDLKGTAPLYATPTFSTSHPEWQWLNRVQGLVLGHVILDSLRVEADIYVPRLKSGVPRV